MVICPIYIARLRVEACPFANLPEKKGGASVLIRARSYHDRRLASGAPSGSGHHRPPFEWGTVTFVVLVEVLPASSVASTVMV